MSADCLTSETLYIKLYIRAYPLQVQQTEEKGKKTKRVPTNTTVILLLDQFQLSLHSKVFYTPAFKPSWP